jgi:deazaflavin-dependent oxidoreductase (nitroreductase family)
MVDESNFNEGVIAEFRSNSGKVGGYFNGSPMLLLTTTGVKSGEERVSPLVYTTDGGRIVIVASNGGADRHPSWYYNVVANPQITVEVGDETYQANAVITDPAERRRLFDLHAQRFPGFKEYEKGTHRVIPVIVLDRIEG